MSSFYISYYLLVPVCLCCGVCREIPIHGFSKSLQVSLAKLTFDLVVSAKMKSHFEPMEMLAPWCHQCLSVHMYSLYLDYMLWKTNVPRQLSAFFLHHDTMISLIQTKTETWWWLDDVLWSFFLKKIYARMICQDSFTVNSLQFIPFTYYSLH